MYVYETFFSFFLNKPKIQRKFANYFKIAFYLAK